MFDHSLGCLDVEVFLVEGIKRKLLLTNLVMEDAISRMSGRLFSSQSISVMAILST